MKRQTGMTAQELMSRLQADAAYQAKRAAKDKELAERAEERKLEQKPLLDDLAAHGVFVASVDRLVGMPSLDDCIYRILLDHLRRPYSASLLEWIGRAFGHKSARPIVWKVLIPLLKTHALKEPAVIGLMAAISKIAGPRDLHILIDLISDQAIGSSRLSLVSNLMRSKQPEARATLLRLRDDPELVKEISYRLRRSKG
ncbi:hypothetical protein [Novosphingobium naphthalenivorans]|uniref:hypothetical protein n=1 Tax=Novosphingobium naphthalenivorans TaxID=273168 RepID=UPI00082D5ADA|nr:hypothetical protein [Novosphingobium naphthalenivorans]